MNIKDENLNHAQQYKKIRDVASGGGGNVILVRDTINNREVIMKVSKRANMSMGVPMEYIREIEFFTELAPFNHPNIVKLYDCFVDKNRVHLILEPCHGDLLDLISNKEIPLSIADIKAIMFDVLTPLQFCHSRYIAHRDIKPENYLVGKDKRLRLSDFGLSRYVGTPRDHYTQNIQTSSYHAPEILFHSTLYTTAIDMWSVGCILGALLLRAPLFFAGPSDIDELFSIFYLLGTPTKEDWPDVENYPRYVQFEKHFERQSPSRVFPNAPEDVLDLLYKLLEYNPDKRITAEEALNHPFFTNEPAMTPFNELPYK